jgi:hypothetical protein
MFVTGPSAAGTLQKLESSFGLAQASILAVSSVGKRRASRALHHFFAAEEDVPGARKEPQDIPNTLAIPQSLVPSGCWASLSTEAEFLHHLLPERLQDSQQELDHVPHSPENPMVLREHLRPLNYNSASDD